jgi:hypothetical protein
VADNRTRDDILLFRLNSDGALDRSFGRAGVVTFSGAGEDNDYGNWVAFQTEGKITVSDSVSNGPAFDVLLLRYLPDGARIPGLA